jgi:predicted XRE-type DNA-binding protein
MKKCNLMKMTLLLLVFSFSIDGIGQNRFVNAVIYKTNGDSIKGKIDYELLFNTPDEIILVNENKYKDVFEAELIKSFYIPSTSEFFESHKVKIDLLSGDSETSILYGIVNPSTISKTVFLLSLVNSKDLKLFEFKDKNKIHLFYIKNNREPTELIHNYKYDEINYLVKENNMFRQQISNLLNDCNEINSELIKMKFSKAQIQKIFIDYLKCKDPNVKVLENTKDNSIIQFGVINGLSYNRQIYLGTIGKKENSSSYNLSYSLGLTLNYSPSVKFNRLHVINELYHITYGNNNKKYDFNVKVSYIQLNSMLRYNIKNKKKIEPFVDIGIANGFRAIIWKNDFTDNPSRDFYFNPKFWTFSRVIGVGVGVNKIEIQYKYIYSLKNFPFNQQSHSVFLGYNFSKSKKI